MAFWTSRSRFKTFRKSWIRFRKLRIRIRNPVQKRYESEEKITFFKTTLKKGESCSYWYVWKALVSVMTKGDQPKRFNCILWKSGSEFWFSGRKTLTALRPQQAMKTGIYPRYGIVDTDLGGSVPNKWPPGPGSVISYFFFKKSKKFQKKVFYNI